jgi:hypothetical protein
MYENLRVHEYSCVTVTEQRTGGPTGRPFDHSGVIISSSFVSMFVVLELGLG